MRNCLRPSPRVSVIMPAFNAEATIAEAIRSVLAQTMSDWELIVMDDCSRDNTLAIVRGIAQEDTRIRIIPGEKNMGVASVRNRAIDLSEGEYIAFLDSDDVWHPLKLEKQLQRLSDTGADICYTSYAIVNDALSGIRPDYIVPEQVDFQHLLRENVIGCSTVILRAEVAKSYKFRTDFYHEDYILWLELLKQGYTAAGCTDVLTRWRYQAGSRSFNKWKSLRNRWKIYREYLGLSALKSTGIMIHYAYHGLMKYMRR